MDADLSLFLAVVSRLICCSQQSPGSVVQQGLGGGDQLSRDTTLASLMCRAVGLPRRSWLGILAARISSSAPMSRTSGGYRHDSCVVHCCHSSLPSADHQAELNAVSDEEIFGEQPRAGRDCTSPRQDIKNKLRQMRRFLFVNMAFGSGVPSLLLTAYPQARPRYWSGRQKAHDQC